MRTVSIRLSNAGRLGAHWTRRPLGNRAPALGDTDGPQRMSLYGERRIALAAGAEVFHRQRVWGRDDDFDFGLLVDGAEFSSAWLIAFQREFQGRLEAQLAHDGDGALYCSRIVNRTHRRSKSTTPRWDHSPSPVSATVARGTTTFPSTCSSTSRRRLRRTARSKTTSPCSSLRATSSRGGG